MPTGDMGEGREDELNVLLCRKVTELSIGTRPSKGGKESFSMPKCWWALALAAVAGFEPADTGVKVPCLTAWRHRRIAGSPRQIQSNP